MSAPDRRALIDRGARSPSIRRQCTLLGVARSAGVFGGKPVANRWQTASSSGIVHLNANSNMLISPLWDGWPSG
jgi:hypothetical protein